MTTGSRHWVSKQWARHTLPVVYGISGAGRYSMAGDIESLSRLRKTSPQIHLLSPFDNFIIARDRISRLFGFDYSLECYTPASMRNYGYFVLPILWGEQFAGRLDPKADRKYKTLIIKSITGIAKSAEGNLEGIPKARSIPAISMERGNTK